MKAKCSPRQAQAYQAAAWQRAMAVRLAQVLGQPVPYGSKMVPGSKATKPAPKGKPKPKG